MNKSVRILVGGLVLAGVVFVAGKLLEHKYLRQIETGISWCMNIVMNKYNAEGGPVPDFLTECDPVRLAHLSRREVEALGYWQTFIADPARKRMMIRRGIIPVSLLVVCLSAIPWLWYFLLRRLAEVGKAISGRPPSE